MVYVIKNLSIEYFNAQYISVCVLVKCYTTGLCLRILQCGNISQGQSWIGYVCEVIDRSGHPKRQTVSVASLHQLDVSANTVCMFELHFVCGYLKGRIL